METTTTFRDYAADSFGGGVFSIDTTGKNAVLSLALNHPEFTVNYKFDRAVARQLGTDLLRWSGGPGTCTLQPVEYLTVDGKVAANGSVLRVEVIDGTVMFLLSDGTFQATDEEVIDLAQRLIVFAGVDVNAPVHA
jgi:hypothetical protein